MESIIELACSRVIVALLIACALSGAAYSENIPTSPTPPGLLESSRDLDEMIECFNSCKAQCDLAYATCPGRNRRLCEVIWHEGCPKDCATGCYLDDPSLMPWFPTFEN